MTFLKRNQELKTIANRRVKAAGIVGNGAGFSFFKSILILNRKD